MHHNVNDSNFIIRLKIGLKVVGLVNAFHQSAPCEREEK